MNTALILILANKGKTIRREPIIAGPPLVTTNGGASTVYPPHSLLI